MQKKAVQNSRVTKSVTKGVVACHYISLKPCPETATFVLTEKEKADSLERR